MTVLRERINAETQVLPVDAAIGSPTYPAFYTLRPRS